MDRVMSGSKTERALFDTRQVLMKDAGATLESNARLSEQGGVRVVGAITSPHPDQSTDQ